MGPPKFVPPFSPPKGKKTPNFDMWKTPKLRVIFPWKRGFPKGRVWYSPKCPQKETLFFWGKNPNPPNFLKFLNSSDANFPKAPKQIIVGVKYPSVNPLVISHLQANQLKGPTFLGPSPPKDPKTTKGFNLSFFKP